MDHALKLHPQGDGVFHEKRGQKITYKYEEKGMCLNKTTRQNTKS